MGWSTVVNLWYRLQSLSTKPRMLGLLKSWALAEICWSIVKYEAALEWEFAFRVGFGYPAVLDVSRSVVKTRHIHPPGWHGNGAKRLILSCHVCGLALSPLANHRSDGLSAGWRWIGLLLLLNSLLSHLPDEDSCSRTVSMHQPGLSSPPWKLSSGGQRDCQTRAILQSAPRGAHHIRGQSCCPYCALHWMGLVWAKWVFSDNVRAPFGDILGQGWFPMGSLPVANMGFFLSFFFP